MDYKWLMNLYGNLPDLYLCLVCNNTMNDHSDQEMIDCSPMVFYLTIVSYKFSFGLS